MNLRVTFHSVPSLSDLEPFRRTHLEALAEPQAPLLEVLVQDAAYYLIRARAVDCGYVIVRDQDKLIEFHLEPAYWVFGEVVIKQALQKLSLRRAVIQQFDALLLSSCLPLQSRVRSLGLLVRDYVPRELPELPGIRFSTRTALASDLPAIKGVDQQVFTHPERLAQVVAAGYMQLYERDGALLGFGILRPVGEQGSAVELGIAVDRPYRARGYAVYMLRAMIDHCLARGLRPIAGCEDGNSASRNMGERVGLVARYRMLELEF